MRRPAGTRAVAWAAALVLFALAPACRSRRGPAAAAGGDPPPLDVVRVAARPLDITVRLTGEIVPSESVAIYPKVTGFVEWIGVDRGSRARAGEPIVRLSAPEIDSQRAEAESKEQSAEAQRIEAEARLASDEGTYQRLRDASATPGVIAGNELEVAQRTAEADRARVRALQQSEAAAKAALEALRETERYLLIRAPFDGVITERNVHPGALVGPAAGTGPSLPMLRIETLDRLRLVVAVPEADVSEVPGGTEVGFTVAAFPGEIFKGRVARAARSVDVKTRTMPVELDVENRSGRLLPGMFPEVSWPVRRPHPTLFVPASAVARTTERVFVVRVRDGAVQPVEVTTGASSGDLVEVFGDLREGDAVALRGTDELRPGTRVTPRDRAPS
jgi:membrane fusion protein, multidrug efflux system